MGDLAWKPATPEFATATEPISELIHDRSDIFAGSVVSTDASYVEIFVVAGSTNQVRTLLGEVGIDPSLYILSERQRSANDLEQEMMAARDRLETAGIAVSSLVLDPVRDGIQVVLSSSGIAGRSVATPVEASGVLEGLPITDISRTASDAVDFSSALDGPNSAGEPS